MRLSITFSPLNLNEETNSRKSGMGKSWSGKREIRNANKVFVGKVKVNAHLGDQTINESVILRWIFKKM